MAMINTSKPSTPTVTNTSRVASYETWATITTTWASETRTWEATGSLVTNTSRPTSNMTNTARPS